MSLLNVLSGRSDRKSDPHNFIAQIVGDSGIVLEEYRTREGWRRIGMRVKRGAEGELLPFVPTEAANLHIKRIRVFQHREVEQNGNRRSQRMPDKQRYKPLGHDALWFHRQVYYKGEPPRRGRPRKRPSVMDAYWFVPVPIVDYKDYKNIAPRRTVIYPAQGLGVNRRPKDRQTKECAVCGADFIAKRADARCCSPKCRKVLSRRKL